MNPIMKVFFSTAYMPTARGRGVDEPNLWGDFFYMEGLLRLLRRDWIPFL